VQRATPSPAQPLHRRDFAPDDAPGWGPRLFGYRGWRLVRAILLPGTLPSYLAGLRSGLGLGWMFVVVAAELMGASRGLGYLLVDGQTTSRPELVMAAIALFALLGKLTDRGLEWLGRRCSSPAPRTS
jgi:ABC-type nitrate/sulfonate/bicarbonate transport system permease component